MARDFAKRFYNGSSWRKVRAAYVKKVHGLCERCLLSDKYVEGKIVHHKIYLTPENINYPHISLNEDNLELLCMTCHNSEHFSFFEPTREDVEFDQNGFIVERGTNE